MKFQFPEDFVPTEEQLELQFSVNEWKISHLENHVSVNKGNISTLENYVSINEEKISTS